MGDDVKCPECGAPAIVQGDGKKYCQGPSLFTAEAVAEIEGRLRLAQSKGDDLKDIDAEHRKALDARSCGKVS